MRIRVFDLLVAEQHAATLQQIDNQRIGLEDLMAFVLGQSVVQDAGIIAVSSTPGELKAFVRSETERWGKVIRDNANYIFE